MNKQKGILLVLSTALISGVSIFINSFGVQVINPHIFTGLKNLITALFILAIILSIGEFKKFKALTKKQWLQLVSIGFVGGSIPFLLFFKGLSITTGPEGALMHKLMFLPVILMAFIFLKEKINKSLLIGAGLLLLGNIFLLRFNFSNIFWDKGDLLILIAVLFWSVEQIISKKAVAEISPRIIALGRLGFGFGFILLFWLATDQIGLLTNLSLHQFNWTLITAIILLGYVLTWYAGLKYIKLSNAICILALGAPITALLAMQFNIGILLIFFGVILCLDLNWRQNILLNRISLVFAGQKIKKIKKNWLAGKI